MSGVGPSLPTSARVTIATGAMPERCAYRIQREKFLLAATKTEEVLTLCAALRIPVTHPRVTPDRQPDFALNHHVCSRSCTLTARVLERAMETARTRLREPAR